MEGVKKITIVDEFIKEYGAWCGIIQNEKIIKYFLTLSITGRVGLVDPDTWDKEVEYTPTQIKGIPANKHCAYYKEFAYMLEYIKNAEKLIHPNEYGFYDDYYSDDKGDKLLCLKNGSNIIVIAPMISELWKELAHIPIEDIMKDRPSSVLVI